VIAFSASVAVIEDIEEIQYFHKLLKIKEMSVFQPVSVSSSCYFKSSLPDHFFVINSVSSESCPERCNGFVTTFSGLSFAVP